MEKWTPFIKRQQLRNPLDQNSKGVFKSALEDVQKDVIQRRTRFPLTILSGATNFNVGSDYMVLTAQAAVTIATIGGGREGQILTLEFTDANITITDTGTGVANTVNLDSAFTSVANGVLKVIFNGTSWREVSRSTGVLYKVGTATKTLSDADQTVNNYAHGLGRVPKLVRLVGGVTADEERSIGAYDGTTNVCYFWDQASTPQTNSTFAITLHTASSVYQRGVVTVDATNIIITWTKNGSPVGTGVFIWEVSG